MMDLQSLLKGGQSMSSEMMGMTRMPQNAPPCPIGGRRLNEKNRANLLSATRLAKSRRFTSLNDVGNAALRSGNRTVHHMLLGFPVLSGKSVARIGLRGR